MICTCVGPQHIAKSRKSLFSARKKKKKPLSMDRLFIVLSPHDFSLRKAFFLVKEVFLSTQLISKRYCVLMKSF